MTFTEKKIFFAAELLSWNKKENTRAMPWKGEKDPYKIWLSEVILQQTRVEQGLDYYNRFIKKFPTVQQLAAAPEAQVFKLWEGLGYYSRCKNLVETARYVSEALHGNFPDNYPELLTLKGIGPYTAAAIASFAFGKPYAVTDGNVFRVLARFFGMADAIDSTAGRKKFTDLAQVLLEKQEPGIYNQAIMDFGAVICRPKLPLCPQCPLQAKCTAFRKGLINELPFKEKKLQKKKRWFFYIVAQYNGSVYVRQRLQADIWQNLWEFILVETPAEISSHEFLRSESFSTIGIGKHDPPKIFPPQVQQLTHQTIETVFIYLSLSKPIKDQSYSLLSVARIKKMAFPRTLNVFITQNLSACISNSRRSLK